MTWLLYGICVAPPRPPQRYDQRDLTVRVGTIELRVPRDCEGTFRTELFRARHEGSLIRPPEAAWNCSLRCCKGFHPMFTSGP